MAIRGQSRRQGTDLDGISLLALIPSCGGGDKTTATAVPQTVEWGQALEADGLRVTVSEPVKDETRFWQGQGRSESTYWYLMAKVTFEVISSPPTRTHLDETRFTYHCGSTDWVGQASTSDVHPSLPEDLGILEPGGQAWGYAEFMVSPWDYSESSNASGAGDYVRLDLPAENGAPGQVWTWRTP